MQSMAEHYLQQGIEQGTRNTTIRNTLALLRSKFSGETVNEIARRLQRINDVKSKNIWAPFSRTCDESHDYEPLFAKA